MLRAFLLVEDHTTPPQEVASWWLADVELLSQPPMRRLAPALNAKLAWADHDDKAVVFKFAKPAPHIVAMAMRAKLYHRGPS